MVLVPAGSFLFGCNAAVDQECDVDEMVGRTEELPAYWIDRTEVTVSRYRSCVRSGACERPDEEPHCSYRKAKLDRPVTCVDMLAAEAYCRWRGKRLPTEREWEKAARGTDGRTYPWGNAPIGSQPEPVANVADRRTRFKGRSESYDDGYRATSPVGAFPAGASPYGALDLAGNVQEWTTTRYAEKIFPNDDNRIIKGGSFSESYWYTRIANRVVGDARGGAPHVGFRCVRPAEPAEVDVPSGSMPNADAGQAGPS